MVAINIRRLNRRWLRADDKRVLDVKKLCFRQLAVAAACIGHVSAAADRNRRGGGVARGQRRGPFIGDEDASSLIRRS
jgi:hypothetical protein